MKKCTLALGCFWKPEENFKNKPGIIETEVGYAGGLSNKVTYEEVCKGDTGHAEVVRLTFGEKLISFKKILDLFFKMHDPTQKDMQYPDVGTQYSLILIKIQSKILHYLICYLQIKNGKIFFLIWV